VFISTLYGGWCRRAGNGRGIGRNYTILATVLAFLAGLPAVAVHAQVGGEWTATSTNSIAITGDIQVGENVVVFGNGTRLPLKRVEERQGQWTPVGGETTGTIYGLMPPADPVLLNGNTLCGMPEPATYIVLSQPSRGSLGLSVFTGAEPPRGSNDPVCAVYFYER